MPILNQIISDGIDNNYEPDDIVTSFTKFITERANPYFQKRHIPNKMPAFANGNTKEKQKWYNYECSQKHARYQEALYNYNLNRNRENRMLMLDAKKDYKYFCRKCKLKYKYDQGKNMNEMRKKQPREFWRLFKNKSNTETGHEISLDDFYHYFRSRRNAVRESGS